MKMKFLFIGLLCLSLLSCEKDNKREGDVFDEDKKENVEQEEVRGFLPGVFSVSANKQVQFSQGNLQYQASTDTWRFAENQYDIVGIGYGLTDEEEDCYVGGTVLNSDNREISPKYTGWIDLFGWGTGNNPTNKSTNYKDYSTFVDWGVNKISNEGNVENEWFTLSSDEWNYLLNRRPNASSKNGVAMVNGVNGLVLLPDSFTSTIYNNYTASDWEKMEEDGAVFLPFAGLRYFDSFVKDCGKCGYYWTSNYSIQLYITKSKSEVENIANVLVSCGQSVRLCKIYEK